ncbi:hypothetical protein [Alkalispirochaeta alkalica]|uniref:hypothetical protein n=1 Tax=Alkalispirochaeta alkalica TaxID=46356 RepID=UPI00037179D6|nr:hypothetical protein [Alkalispirochaeta alkalica]
MRDTNKITYALGKIARSVFWLSLAHDSQWFETACVNDGDSFAETVGSSIWEKLRVFTTEEKLLFRVGGDNDNGADGAEYEAESDEMQKKRVELAAVVNSFLIAAQFFPRLTRSALDSVIAKASGRARTILNEHILVFVLQDLEQNDEEFLSSEESLIRIGARLAELTDGWISKEVFHEAVAEFDPFFCRAVNGTIQDRIKSLFEVVVWRGNLDDVFSVWPNESTRDHLSRCPDDAMERFRESLLLRAWAISTRETHIELQGQNASKEEAFIEFLSGLSIDVIYFVHLSKSERISILMEFRSTFKQEPFRELSEEPEWLQICVKHRYARRGEQAGRYIWMGSNVALKYLYDEYLVDYSFEQLKSFFPEIETPNGSTKELNIDSLKRAKTKILHPVPQEMRVELEKYKEKLTSIDTDSR